MSALLIVLVVVLVGVAIAAGLILTGVIPNPFKGTAAAAPTLPRGPLVNADGSVTISGKLATPLSLEGRTASQPIRLTNMNVANNGGNIITNATPKGSGDIPSGFNNFYAYKIDYKTYLSSQFPPFIGLYVDDAPVDAFAIEPKVSTVPNSVVRRGFTANNFYDVRLLAPTTGMQGIITDVYITFYK